MKLSPGVLAGCVVLSGLSAPRLALSQTSQGLTDVSWTRVGPPNLGAGKLVIDPRDPQVFYTTGNLCPSVPAGCAGVLKSVDRGATWNRVFEGFSEGGLPPSAGGVVLDPVVSPSALFAGSYVPFECAGLLATSPDGGVTWTYAGGGPVYVLKVSPSPPRALFYSTICYRSGRGSDGLYKSSDGGRTSKIVSGFVEKLAIAPSDPNVVYATQGPTFSASSDGGTTWVLVNSGVAFYQPVLVVDPVAPTTIYLGTTEGEGQVIKSVDGGRTWLAPGVGIAAGRINDLVIDPFSPSVLYAASTSGLYRSGDSGGTWIRISSGLPTTQVYFVTLDPLAPSTVFAVTEDYGLYRTTFQDPGACVASATTLCLGSNRFRLSVLWESPSGAIRAAAPAPITANAGAFWFFDSSNLELVVKVLDGRSVNGKFWVFYGSLTNVEFTLTVTDTETGAVKTYFNAQGQLVSVADTSAF
jgi:hypothetical protein